MQMYCTVTKAHKAVFLWGWGLNGSLDNSFHSWLGSAGVGCDVGLVTSLAWNGMNANELYGHQSPQGGISLGMGLKPVSYTHLRAHETRHDLVCRLLLEKKK